MGVPMVRAAVQATRDSFAGCLSSGTFRFRRWGTGWPKRTDWSGASCWTRSHRPLARFRFRDGSQHTDSRQMGPSHECPRSPIPGRKAVRPPRAIAVWSPQPKCTSALSRQPGFDRLSTIDGPDKKLDSQFLSMPLHVDHLHAIAYALPMLLLFAVDR